MKITAPLALTIPAVFTLLTGNGVHAHGGMVDPLPRALTTMGLNIDNTFGWPIDMRASVTNGRGGDCLGFIQDGNLKTIPSGTSKIKMRANDGANHIGPCTVYLVNPSDSSRKLQIGQLNDCMRSLHPGPGNKGDPPIPAEMTINVPSDASRLPCNSGHCVLLFAWEATHLTPHEFFNNCADVKISGTSGGGGGGGGGGKGDWDFCSVSSECNNGCCSKQYSDDGRLKCTPGGSPGQCVSGGGGGGGGGSKGDWDFCAVSSECKNGCCSKQYSDDGKLKCTPGGSPGQCVSGGGGGGGGGGSKGDWDFCAVSAECKNSCCSKQYSDDGKLKCTPGGSRDQCT